MRPGGPPPLLLFWTLRSAVAELSANRCRSRQLAGGRPSDMALGYGPRSECWHRPTDRFLNLLGKGVAVNHPFRVSRARARGPPIGQRFRSGGAGAELWGLFGARRSKPLAEGCVNPPLCQLRRRVAPRPAATTVFLHLRCLGIASSSSSSDHGEIPSAPNLERLVEAVVSIRFRAERIGC